MTHEELMKQLSNQYHTHDFFTIREWRKDDFDEEGCHMEIFERVKNPTPEDFLQIPFTLNGDYVGCVTCQSNCRSIKRDFCDDVILVWGSYSSQMLLVRLSDLAENEELLNVIDEIIDYPLYDDSDESELLIELENEAWDNWVKYDFKSELSKYIDEDIDDETYDLAKIFWKFQQITGETFETEMNDVIFDVDGMVKTMVNRHAEEFWEILQENKKDQV